MRNYRDEIRTAIEACHAAFADKSMYELRAVRDYHIQELKKLLSSDIASDEERARIVRTIEFIVIIDTVELPECCAFAG